MKNALGHGRLEDRANNFTAMRIGFVGNSSPMAILIHPRTANHFLRYVLKKLRKG